MSTIDFILNEQTILRNELQELKKCQIQYFLLSITAAGAVFGFNKELGGQDIENMIYLAPMLIILPCWLTFFDKANTITRLTGYVVVFIEGQMVTTKPKYIGYESALAIFREEEKKQEAETKTKNKVATTKVNNEEADTEADKDTNKDFFNVTRHQYWKINWLTFFALSLTCIVFPIVKRRSFVFLTSWASWTVYFIFFCLEVFCVVYSFRILWRLIIGKYSYKKVADFWRQKVLPNVK